MMFVRLSADSMFHDLADDAGQILSRSAKFLVQALCFVQRGADVGVFGVRSVALFLYLDECRSGVPGFSSVLTPSSISCMNETNLDGVENPWGLCPWIILLRVRLRVRGFCS